MTWPRLEAEVVAAVTAAPTHVKPRVARELPVIRMEVGEIERVVDDAEAALAASGRGIYQRGGQIVTVGETPILTAVGAEISSQRIFEAGGHALLEHLAASARWESYDARRERKKEDGQAVPWKRAAPQMWIAKSLRERTGRLSLPVLSGVVSAPTMRSDGSLLTAEGYDARTGLLLDTRGAAFPAISEAPDREAAKEAMGTLRALIGTLPFVADADRSVALSAIVTAPIRRSLRTAPLFAFTSPVPGSGKSLLVDIVSILATGIEAGVVAQGRDEAESEKRLGALTSPHRVVHMQFSGA